MRIGTVGIGRIGGIGGGPCYADVGGQLGDGTDEDGYACLYIPPSTGEPTPGTGIENQPWSPYTPPIGLNTPTLRNLPISLPVTFAPSGVTPKPSGLQTNQQCPSGYTSTGGICVAPSSTFTFPTWGVLAAVAVLALGMFGGKR